MKSCHSNNTHQEKSPQQNVDQQSIGAHNQKSRESKTLEAIEPLLLSRLPASHRTQRKQLKGTDEEWRKKKA